METDKKFYLDNYDNIHDTVNQHNEELDKCYNEINSLKGRMDSMVKHVENLTRRIYDMEEENKNNKKIEEENRILRQSGENHDHMVNKEKNDAKEIMNLATYASITKTYMLNENLEELKDADKYENTSIDNAEFHDNYIKKSIDDRKEIPKEYVINALNYIKEQKVKYNTKDKIIKGSNDIISSHNYDNKLEELINKAKTTLVFKGIKTEVFNKFQAKLLQSKVVNMLQSKTIRESKVSKSIISHILSVKLKIEPEIYNKIVVKEIYRNESGDIIVQFINNANVGYIFSVMKNLDEDDMLSINQYVPAEFYKRHREINAICKIYRNTNNVNTHVRIGKKDYKVFVKNKEDVRPWSEIAPLYLPSELSKFEIGIIAKEKTNKRLRDDIDTDDESILYDCNQCGFNGRSASHLDHHVRNIHENHEVNTNKSHWADPFDADNNDGK